VVIFAIAQLSS